MILARQTTALTTYVLEHWMGVVVIYVLLLFALPANSQTMQAYDLSSLEYHILLFIVALPTILAWLAAFWGYAVLRQYAVSIKDSKEGPCFDRLADGTYWLAWSLPVPAIMSLILNALGDQSSAWHTVAIIVTGYLTLVMPLIAFVLISGAAHNLLKGTKRGAKAGSSQLVMIAFIVLGVLYCYLSFRRLDLNSLGSADNPYALPVWLIVLSITIPYLYTWFVGLFSAYEITLFSRLSPGFLYRRALGMVAGGLTIIILSSIALQYVNGLVPSVGHLVVNYKLALVVLFRIFSAGGFILMALGAKRLKRIEEV